MISIRFRTCLSNLHFILIELQVFLNLTKENTLIQKVQTYILVLFHSHLINLLLIIYQEISHFPLEIILIGRNNVSMQVVMLDLIHLYKRNMPLSILPNVLLKQQMSLFYGDYLIG